MMTQPQRNPGRGELVGVFGEVRFVSDHVPPLREANWSGVGQRSAVRAGAYEMTICSGVPE